MAMYIRRQLAFGNKTETRFGNELVRKLKLIIFRRGYCKDVSSEYHEGFKEESAE